MPPPLKNCWRLSLPGALRSSVGLKIVHQGSKWAIKCDICKLAFYDSRNLKKHKIIHAGEKPSKCYVCELAFSKSGSIKIHKLIHSFHLEIS